MFGTCPNCNSDHIGFKFTPDHTIKYCRGCGQTLKIDGTAITNGSIHLPAETLEAGRMFAIFVTGSLDDSAPTIPTNDEYAQDTD